MQPDPIGYGGGSNLYAYVSNDPLNLIDPVGLWSLDLNLGVVGASIGIGEKSGQAFVIAKAGIVGLGVTYTPTADVPLGQSGEFPGSCASCSVNRVYWETTKGDLGAVIGPINLSLISKQGDMLVNEYGKSGLISSSVIPGGPPAFDPSVSLGADRKIGVKLDASYYGEVGWSVPWQDIKTSFGASSGTSTPASGAPK